MAPGSPLPSADGSYYDEEDTVWDCYPIPVEEWVDAVVADEFANHEAGPAEPEDHHWAKRAPKRRSEDDVAVPGEPKRPRITLTYELYPHHSTSGRGLHGAASTTQGSEAVPSPSPLPSPMSARSVKYESVSGYHASSGLMAPIRNFGQEAEKDERPVPQVAVKSEPRSASPSDGDMAAFVDEHLAQMDAADWRTEQEERRELELRRLFAQFAQKQRELFERYEEEQRALYVRHERERREEAFAEEGLE